ncbi:Conodipine-M alpha chain [Mizuhopecten yessoensis]|uniref:Conodipine-M alpha chain n=1 Tax=Mizuhopecten yessoensis TaxID=6573 RepID=A0A210PN60_MIZYE|nr:Conodipine-M alpha chain [Mizuhopecten yessoensis]
MILTLAAICLLIELSLAANPCTTSSHSDGCSIPGDLPFFYKDTFTPNCNQHDVCYFCAVRYGLVRHDCDNLFLKNMEASCSHLDRKRFLFGDSTDTQHTHHACMASAFVYYEAVYLGAESHFEQTSPSWCGESWVRQCLP